MTELRKLDGEILIGSKPMGTYINASVMALFSRSKIVIKARGKNALMAIDLSQILQRRMGVSVNAVRIGSETFRKAIIDEKSGQNKEIDLRVSTIEIEVGKSATQI